MPCAISYFKPLSDKTLARVRRAIDDAEARREHTGNPLPETVRRDSGYRLLCHVSVLTAALPKADLARLKRAFADTSYEKRLLTAQRLRVAIEKCVDKRKNLSELKHEVVKLMDEPGWTRAVQHAWTHQSIVPLQKTVAGKKFDDLDKLPDILARADERSILYMDPFPRHLKNPRTKEDRQETNDNEVLRRLFRGCKQGKYAQDVVDQLDNSVLKEWRVPRRSGPSDKYLLAKFNPLGCSSTLPPNHVRPTFSVKALSPPTH